MKKSNNSDPEKNEMVYTKTENDDHFDWYQNDTFEYLSDKALKRLSKAARRVLWFFRIMLFMACVSVVAFFVGLYQSGAKMREERQKQRELENSFTTKVVIDDGGLFNDVIRCDSAITGKTFTVLYRKSDSIIVSNSHLISIERVK